MNDTPLISIVIIPRDTASDHRDCAEKLYTRFGGQTELLYSNAMKNEGNNNGINTIDEGKHIIPVPRKEEESDETALRKCIKVAKGEYIYIMDARNFPENNFVDILTEKGNIADADIVIFDCCEINPDNGNRNTLKGIENTEKIKNTAGFNRNDSGDSILLLSEPTVRNKLFKSGFLKSDRSGLSIAGINGVSAFAVFCMVKAKKITYIEKTLIQIKTKNNGQNNSLNDLYNEIKAFLTEVRKLDFFDSGSGSAYAFTAETLLKQLKNRNNIYTPVDFTEYLYKIVCLFNTADFKPGKMLKGEYSALFTSVKNKTFCDYFDPEEDLDNKTIESLKKLRQKGYLPNNGFTDEKQYVLSAVSLYNELETLKKSDSYRIGRIATWLPRKIRGVFRCLKEHGTVYTIKKTGESFGIRINNREKKKKEIHKEKMKYAVRRIKRKQPITISMTSFPARIEKVDKTIRTLMDQSVKPDRIILWLAREQFPGRKKDLPQQLLKLRRYGLSIKWCDDIKSHKKYYYVMKRYPKDLIITADDDIYYGKDTLRNLYESYKKYPHAVSAIRAHLITFSAEASVNPYKEWIQEYGEIKTPSMRIIATGVGGILYPPGSMHSELFNKDMILKTCINGDDLWLKTMQVMNRTPVVVAANNGKLSYIEDSQKVSLWHDNISGGGNDRQLKAILDEYNEYYGKEDTLIERIRKDK